MNTRNNPYASFFALAKKLNIDSEMRLNLVRQFSKNRTASLTELNSYEYAELIGHLNRQMPKSSPMADAPQKPKVKEPQGWESADAMRKKIFFLFRELGYCWGSEPADKARNAIVVKHYVSTYGYLKCKSLNSYTADELPKLVSQFEQWKKNSDKAAARKAVKELCNELNIPV
jgi:hypothetical protein